MDKEQALTAPEGFGPVLKEYFTGTAWLQMRVVPDEVTNCGIGEVIFEPGCRNNWHTHPSNQILIVIQGTGYYQQEGFPIQKIKVGDVVNILPGVKHWHGATPNDRFTHYAVGINTEKGIVDWLEPVTDEQYHSFTEAKT